MSNFQLNIPIAKVDEEQRIVYGYATKEELDRQGDIVDYEAAKKAFSAWPGNIREQHDAKRAVGKNVHLEFDDNNKQILIGAKLSASTDGENALIKVKEGILTGFSIGGKIYKTVRDTIKGVDGDDVTANRITDFSLAEVSLVDVPACPSAQFVMVKSVDGVAEAVEEMHESADGQPLPWFMKHYAYTLNQNTESIDNTSMSKQSKETTMADADKVEKAEVVETPAAELEKVNVQGGVERDANAEVVEDLSPAAEAAVEEPAVETPVVEDKPSKKKKADEAVETKVETPAVEEKAVTPEVEKTYTVAELKDMLEKAEAAEVPTALEATDLQKMVDEKFVATQPDLIKSVVEAVSAKVAEQFAPLEERLKAIESQPAGQAPVRSYTVVDKVADVVTEQSEYAALVAKADSLPETATVAERTALAQQLMKANSRMRPVPEVTVN